MVVIATAQDRVRRVIGNQEEWQDFGRGGASTLVLQGWSCGEIAWSDRFQEALVR